MPDVNHTFRRGHRIMVQVQSSWFPLTDRNPQTFVHIPSAKPLRVREGHRTRVPHPEPGVGHSGRGGAGGGADEPPLERGKDALRDRRARSKTGLEVHSPSRTRL
jgi:hypothetical protein